MKLKQLLFACALVISTVSFGFEGVIHCKKTQNGVITEFDFYVKGNQIAIIGSDGTGNYKILLDRPAGVLKLLMDVPAFDGKGYYTYTASTMQKNDSLTILKQMQTDVIEIDGESCQGYTVVTDHGSAIAYYGSLEVDLRGFSTYFNDPIYELLDAIDSKKMPRKMVVSKNTGSYTVDLTAEAKSLDASIFEVPSDYVSWEPKAE